MTGRGFQIKEELLLRFCRLKIAQGVPMKSQMNSADLKKTKDVANLRIHVEPAINRIKNFRILKSTLPFSLLQHINDILLDMCCSL